MPVFDLPAAESPRIQALIDREVPFPDLSRKMTSEERWRQWRQKRFELRSRVTIWSIITLVPRRLWGLWTGMTQPALFVFTFVVMAIGMNMEKGLLKLIPILVAIVLGYLLCVILSFPGGFKIGLADQHVFILGFIYLAAVNIYNSKRFRRIDQYISACLKIYFSVDSLRVFSAKPIQYGKRHCLIFVKRNLY